MVDLRHNYEHFDAMELKFGRIYDDHFVMDNLNDPSIYLLSGFLKLAKILDSCMRIVKGFSVIIVEWLLAGLFDYERIYLIIFIMNIRHNQYLIEAQWGSEIGDPEISFIQICG